MNLIIKEVNRTVYLVNARLGFKTSREIINQIVLAKEITPTAKAKRNRLLARTFDKLRDQARFKTKVYWKY